MTSERIKEIQQTTGYPDSVSIQQALFQVWNEVEQESNRLEKPVMQKIAEVEEIGFLENCMSMWQLGRKPDLGACEKYYKIIRKLRSNFSA